MRVPGLFWLSGADQETPGVKIAVGFPGSRKEHFPGGILGMNSFKFATRTFSRRGLPEAIISNRPLAVDMEATPASRPVNQTRTASVGSGIGTTVMATPGSLP